MQFINNSNKTESNNAKQPTPTPVHPTQPNPIVSDQNNFSNTDENSNPSLEDRQKKLNKTRKINTLKSIISVILFIGAAFGFAIGINKYVLQSYQVIGSSMSPTLEEDDWLVISKLGKSFSNAFGEYTPGRGDVIVFSHPKTGEEKSLIKRVIALPGEKVGLSSDGLLVYNDEFPNGFDPDADYRDSLFIPTEDQLQVYAPTLIDGPIVVPEGEVFVSGDNRNPGGSLDSRGSLGTVPTDNVTGVLKARLFPISDLDFTF